jgi:hypothetical protein
MNSSTGGQVKFDRAVVHRYLSDLDSADNTDTQGKLYEELVTYLFSQVPSCIVERNTTNVFRTEQIDLAVGHAATPDGLHLLPHVFLVECKNWSKPVDSLRVGYFINILAARSAELGIIVAAKGITGDRADLTNAHALGLSASPRGIKILVITTEEIANLQTVAEFVDLLHRRYLRAFASGAIGTP